MLIKIVSNTFQSIFSLSSLNLRVKESAKNVVIYIAKWYYFNNIIIIKQIHWKKKNWLALSQPFRLGSQGSCCTQALLLAQCSVVHMYVLNPSLDKQSMLYNTWIKLRIICLKLSQLNSGDLLWLAIKFYLFPDQKKMFLKQNKIIRPKPFKINSITNKLISISSSSWCWGTAQFSFGEWGSNHITTIFGLLKWKPQN